MADSEPQAAHESKQEVDVHQDHGAIQDEMAASRFAQHSKHASELKQCRGRICHFVSCWATYVLGFMALNEIQRGRSVAPFWQSMVESLGVDHSAFHIQNVTTLGVLAFVLAAASVVAECILFKDLWAVHLRRRLAAWTPSILAMALLTAALTCILCLVEHEHHQQALEAWRYSNWYYVDVLTGVHRDNFRQRPTLLRLLVCATLPSWFVGAVVRPHTFVSH